MNIKDAEKAIHQEWLKWRFNNNIDNNPGIMFYHYLEKDKEELLGFKCAGDKYQRINGWVMKWISNNN